MSLAVRHRTSRRLSRTLIGLAFLAGPIAAVASWQLARPSPSARSVPSVHAEQFKRTTIYESRDQPGYTSWVGAWSMPDDSLMVGFVEAQGNVKRASSPPSVIHAFGAAHWDPRYDFWGLSLTARYLRSDDGGRTWRLVRSEPFKSAIPQAYSAQATIALDDGAILRRVNGDDLRNDPRIPHTAFFQRLVPGTGRWTAPQVLVDPRRFTCQISRVRKLSDGRLIATGNIWDVPQDTPLAKRGQASSRFLLMVSSDDGATWHNGLTIPRDVGYLPGNEWDTAELPNGDLLAVMRTYDSPTAMQQVRKQALLVRHGSGWTMTDVRDAPIPHSGHPELLATDEGPILHIATTGIDYTRDGGRAWKPLKFDPPVTYRSPYYPRALETDDGVIHIFGHVGGDDPFGLVNQSITMDTFRLVRNRSR
jgi:hypothetical protein